MGQVRPSGPAHAPPLARASRWLRADARFDLSASLVVFLVAIPLSVGIAAASDAPVMAGLIAAVVGGVVAGSLGGSPLQVSGPAAGLTVVVAELVGQFGWAVTCAITVLAGVLQVALGACRVGRVALAISPTVVHAMLAGIGVTIVLGQLHVLLGGAAEATAWENVRDLPATAGSMNLAAAATGLVVIGLLVLWPRMPAKVRAVPGPLVAIVLVTVTSGLLVLDVAHVALPDDPLSAIQLPQLPEGGQWFAFAVGVATMTIIASVESLLSAVSVDKMRAGHRSDLNRELVGQGGANIASGLLGGLPVTGVIVRSSTNVRAGARTRASAVLHGVWVLLFTVLLVGLVEQVPLAALAGLLIVMGVKLVRPADIAVARKHGDLHVYLVTLGGVVLLDLLQGVLLGLAVSLLGMLRRVVWARVRVRTGDDTDEDGRPRCAVIVEGTLSFLSVPRLSRVLTQVPDGSAVQLELVVDYLDHAAYEHLSGWQRSHEETGGTVAVDEIGSIPRRREGLPRWFSPWSHWQDTDVDERPLIPTQRATGSDHILRPLVAGAREYDRTGAPALRPHLRKLAGSQQPHAVFLTCADSRIVPNVITASGPGDLFTIRNVGNLVPDPGPTGDHSVHAGVLYAVRALAVPTLVVCGHSGCGGMAALLGDRTTLGQDDPMGQWLRWGEPSLSALRDGHPLGERAATDGWSEVDRLAMVNVAVQVDKLQAIPEVANTGVRVVGLFFDIPTGSLLLLDGDRIAPLADTALTG
ncbi:carbonic anhydrase [Actinokineospora baliensis]|uniref:SulP family inorganic anion transporter n=1 Tax=Actinokineospora baliensis TaxID=547056 RepID=UPI00195D583F|nr:bifunctional SulP family inorganic anion transporter/carbonic anhydrase [Actinokineospora baliensis]MBM7775838.1 carbonic anhydrase [Actinokineospora baliensis]